ncbi:MAG: flagellar basal body rod protein FlgC [Hyphomicrobiales bacterium]|nr:flagellar basal body rod protein FlgC [Hyphomicrobiales bacterium]
MIDALTAAMRTAGSGLAAETQRIRIVSENLANANSTGATAGSDPYVRRTITFGEQLSREDGVRFVTVRSIGRDSAPFKLVHDPGNQAADENGNVKTPNVQPMIEMADLREANRSYQANLQVIRQARDLYSMTVDLMKP